MKMRQGFFFAVALSLFAAREMNGQGTFIFNNSAATAITNIATQMRATGLTVAFYYSTNTNAVLNSSLPMSLNTNAVVGLFQAGIFTGGTRAVPGVPEGSYVAAEVWAWSGAYSNAAAAQQAWNYSGCSGENIVIGKSQRFLLGPLGGSSSPPSINTAGRLNAFLVAPNTATPPPCSVPTFTPLPGLPLRFRVQGNSDLVGLRFEIQSCTTLPADDWDTFRRMTNWQTATTFFPSSFPVLWTNTLSTNVPRFFRLKVSR